MGVLQSLSEINTKHPLRLEEPRTEPIRFPRQTKLVCGLRDGAGGACKAGMRGPGHPD